MPRPGYSREDYVEAGYQVASEIGFAALTLRSLGDKLGVDPTAVYRHFRTKDDLLLEMLDRALLPLAEMAFNADDPIGGLLEIGRALRATLTSHYALAGALAHMRQSPPNSIRIATRAIRYLSLIGLTGDALVRHFQALENYVVGSSLMDSALGAESTEARRLHYERLGGPEFRDASVNDERVACLTADAFETGFQALIAAAVAAANAPGAR